MKSLQELFDIGVGGVIAQGRPGYDRVRETCMYGEGCAVGQIIEAHFTPALEGPSIREVIFGPGRLTEEENAATRDAITVLLAALTASDVETDPKTLTFLLDLQDVHDNAAMNTTSNDWFMAQFRAGCMKLANAYGLDQRVLYRPGIQAQLGEAIG